MTSAQRLNEIAEMLAGATKGEWSLNGSQIVSKSLPKKKFGDKLEYKRSYIVCQPHLYSDPQGAELESNIALIVNSKSDITWLLEEVRVLREALKKVEELANHIDSNPDLDSNDDCLEISITVNQALERNEDNE